MGKTGGGILSFVGAILSIAGYPYVGIPLMMVGGVIAQQALKKEAMARMKAAMTGLRANTRTTERPIPVIYGRHRVGGNVLWMSTEGKGPNDFNPTRNKLFMVYGISEGPIDGYEEMFFNDVKVWDARSGQLRTQFHNMFYSEFRTGTNSQAPFSHVATYHNLYDIASETFPLTAVAMVEFFYSSDIYQSIPNVTWTIRGKQVPDWTDVNSPGIVKWTQSGPLQVADLLTNKQYGMGISSANLNVSDLTSAHAYASAAISPASRGVVEIVDMSSQRPKYYERDIQVPRGADQSTQNDNPFGAGSLYNLVFTDKLPIKPGSLTFVSMLGSVYYDSPRSGMISEFGRLLGAAAAQVGSVNYLSGAMAVDRPPQLPYGEPTVLTWTAKHYADWEFSFRTKFQSITRSVFVVSTPETLVETGTVTSNIINLYSSQGGGGTFDYGTGQLNAYFGAHEWYDNNPVEVHYRVSTRARFSTNYPLFEPEKVMDAIKNIQNHYRGFLVYADGKYGIKTDKPEGSVFSFDDDNIIAGTFRLHQPSIKEIPTKVVVKYLDALNNFTPAEASFDVRSVDPGMEIEHVLDMPGLTARDEAMATAYSYANLANLTNFIEFETNHNAIGVEAGDVVDVTHPSAAWSQKLFRVMAISFAKDDKLAISAIEHDPTAYVDDWMQGPMISRNPSFFPKRSYWPPNVSSATLSEYSRTLSDGTTVPAIKYQIQAVDSAFLSVDHWNVYYANATRGQQTRIGYSGVNTVGYLSPVEPGWNIVNIHAVSQFGNESAKVWTGSVQVFGNPEHEWQNWRLIPKVTDRIVVNSLFTSLHVVSDPVLNGQEINAIRHPQDGYDYVVRRSSVGTKTITAYKIDDRGMVIMTHVFSNALWSPEVLFPVGSGYIAATFYDATGPKIHKWQTSDMTAVSCADWTNPLTAGAGPTAYAVTSAFIYLFDLLGQYCVVSKGNLVAGAATCIRSRGQLSLHGSYPLRTYCTATDSWMNVYFWGTTSKDGMDYPQNKIVYAERYTLDFGTCVRSWTHQFTVGSITYVDPNAESFAAVTIPGNEDAFLYLLTRYGDLGDTKTGVYFGTAINSLGARIFGRGSGTEGWDFSNVRIVSDPVLRSDGIMTHYTVKRSDVFSLGGSLCFGTLELDSYELYRVNTFTPINAQTWI